MENILSPLSTFGIGGCMAAAFIYFTYHIITKTIPSILQSHREDLLRLENRYEKRDEEFQKTQGLIVDQLTKNSHILTELHSFFLKTITAPNLHHFSGQQKSTT